MSKKKYRYTMSLRYITGKKTGQEEERETNVYYTPERVYTDLYGDFYAVTDIKENKDWVRPTPTKEAVV